jgi:hypothetical protein
MEGSIRMTTGSQIREQIATFLNNQQSLRSLMEWLTRNIWNADIKEVSARKLGGDIELIVAEYSAHHIDRTELRRQLRGLLGKEAPKRIAPKASQASR